MEPEARTRGKEKMMHRYLDLPMSKQEVLSEIKNSNPYYFIVVASEIAMRYSVEYLRGVSAPDKQYLAIRDLSAARDQIKLTDSDSESSPEDQVGDKVYGLFHSFAKRVLNEGSDIVGDYAEEDFYQAKTSSLELLSKEEDESEGDDYGENTYYDDDDEDEDDDIDEDDEDDLQEDDIDDL